MSGFRTTMAAVLVGASNSQVKRALRSIAKPAFRIPDSDFLNFVDPHVNTNRPARTEATERHVMASGGACCHPEHNYGPVDRESRSFSVFTFARPNANGNVSSQ
jgi:hypothetical protein